MKLLELEPKFLRRENDHLFHFVDTIQEADGVEFLCPVCWKANGDSAIGTHAVICWEPNVPQTTFPTPGRWNLEGTGLHDLTLSAGSSSIALNGRGCGAHFYIRNGEIINA